MKFSPDLNYSFNANLAGQLGPERALLLKELKVWCESHYNRDAFIFAGQGWCWYSAQQLNSKFPFYSTRSIARYLSDLEDSFWIVSGCFNRMKNDRTKWYCVNMHRYRLGVMGSEVKTPSDFDRDWSQKLRDALRDSDFQGWHIPKGAEDPSKIQAPVRSIDVDSIGQNGKCISQNGKSISQNGKSISQNGRPLPTLPNSTTTHLFADFVSLDEKELVSMVGPKQSGLLAGLKRSKYEDLDPDVCLLLVEWLEHKKETKKGYRSSRGIVMQLNKLRKFTYQQIRSAIDAAYSAGWSDFFPKEDTTKQSTAASRRRSGKPIVPNLEAKKPDDNRFSELAKSKKR